jgi:Uma2 family endonuclease
MMARRDRDALLWQDWMRHISFSATQGDEERRSMEAAVVEHRTGRMSGADFRAFQDTRPDHERWELIDGVPVMMTPPTLTHNLIATNLQRLLLDALAAHDPSRIAVQRAGILLSSGSYTPEPDVMVIDADFDAGQRFVNRAYLLSEIVSDTDEVSVPSTKQRWVDVKRDIYRRHAHCEAVLIVSQDRMEVELDLKTERGWISSVLQGAGAELSIPACGLSCFVADLYDRTPLAPRPASQHQL